jgi:hypothetical protein
MRRAWCLALPLFAAACAGDLDGRPASWSYIHAAIVVPSCAQAGCHSELGRAAGLSFVDRDTARALFIGFPVELSLLRGQRPDKPRMPPDLPLPDGDLELIGRWIAAGQPDD